jgi:hypothetical protein
MTVFIGFWKFRAPFVTFEEPINWAGISHILGGTFCLHLVTVVSEMQILLHIKLDDHQID